MIALGGGSVLSERVQQALEGQATVFLEVDADDRLGARLRQRRGPRAPAGRGPRCLRAAARRARAALRASRDGGDRPGRAGRARRRGADARAAVRVSRPGARMLWATLRLRRLPGARRRGPAAATAPTSSTEWPLDRERLARVLRDRRQRRRAVGRGRRRDGAHDHDRARRAEQEPVLGRARLDRAGGRRDDARRSPARPRRRASSAISRASARPPTSAACRSCRCRRRSSPRSTPPMAARPAWTCRRRRTTSAPTTSPRACSSTRSRCARCPPQELAAGWVEVLKTALIAGGELWERVAAGAEVDAGDRVRCARTKLAVVAADERDGGRRQVLNLGHTVGHAIETAGGYGAHRHGEAVGLGLLAALRLSGQDALREQTRAAAFGRGACPCASKAWTWRPCWRRSRATRSAWARGAVRARAGARGRSARGIRSRPRICAPRSRSWRRERASAPLIEVLNGVNLDQLGHRDPAVYGTLTLAELDGLAEQEGHALGLDVRCFQTNHEGAYVERLHAARGDGGRADPEPRRLDALLLGDPGRARDRRPPGGRSPPLRPDGARAVAPPHRSRRSLLRVRARARPGRLPRGAGAAARAPGSGRMSATERASRRGWSGSARGSPSASSTRCSSRTRRTCAT